MALCPNSGKKTNSLATQAKRINTSPYEAMCPMCEQRVTVNITHEGQMDGRTERWAEHQVTDAEPVFAPPQ